MYVITQKLNILCLLFPSVELLLGVLNATFPKTADYFLRSLSKISRPWIQFFYFY